MLNLGTVDPGNIRFMKLSPYKLHDLGIIQKDFRKLQNDPYVKEGYRKKHIIRYEVCSKDPIILRPLPQTPLFQRKKFNPVHGDISRSYPMYQPCQPTMNVISEFIRNTAVKEGARLLVQAQRVTCQLGSPGLPTVEDWHQDDVTEQGVFCVNRHMIKGGVNEFQNVLDLPNSSFLKRALHPGEMVIFEDASIKHRVTPIHCVEECTPEGGYRDVILLSHGGCV